MNKKFSVIIPTMYRPNSFAETLRVLNEIECIHEIIVIENDKCPWEKIKLNKIIYLDMFENIGCNPAWNLGAKIASSDYICLLNDDIVFDFKTVFTGLLEGDFMDQIGIVGLGLNCYSEDIIHDDTKVELRRSFQRGFGFGCCMCMKKENYVQIPNQLKIFWGDEWLYGHQAKPNYEIWNLRTNNVVGATSGNPELADIQNNDTKFWNELIKR